MKSILFILIPLVFAEQHPCYPEDILFTEFADPSDDPNGRYVELYSEVCAGKEVGDVDVVRTPFEKYLKLNPNHFSLEGKWFDHNGFMVICRSMLAEFVYGRGKCDYHSTEVANADGKSSFKIINVGEQEILDIYGNEYGLSDHVPNPLPSDFSDGRAVRNQMPLEQGLIRNTGMWFPSQWMISKAAVKDMDPGEWVDPPPKLLLTEVSYPSESALNFIEIYSPNLKGTHIRDPLHLVTFSHGLLSPDQRSISLVGEKIGHDGFLLLCTTDYVSPHYSGYNLCDISDINLGKLNDFDAIAIVKGFVSGPHPHFDIVDIYGDLGCPISINAGRAVRKLLATSPRSEYEESEWIKMETNYDLLSDPRQWRYETPINVGDGCDIDNLIITEIADPYEDKRLRFIEVYSPSLCAHGKSIRNFSIVSHNGSYGSHHLEGYSLDGLKLNDNGFLVICVGRSFTQTHDFCDEYAGSGSVVDNDGTHDVALTQGHTIVDVYGASNKCTYTDNWYWSSAPSWCCFTNGRVVRRKSAIDPSIIFNSNNWITFKHVPSIRCDPGEWTGV